MIEISAKALRFARLAAEEQPRFASNAQLSVIAEKERDFRSSLEHSRQASRHIQISDETAEFCLEAIASLLEQESFFSSDDWDGNDFEFMKNISKSLSQSLSSGITFL